MAGPIHKPQQQWVNLEGTLGEFTAPGSAVDVVHLSTFASRGDTGTGRTPQTPHRLPVRELFEVGDLNFDELLQRDLDDYRVAKEIIPYLLENSPLVRFFPPILAVVVPVANRRVVDYYPEPKVTTKPHGESGFEVETQTFGGCLQLVRYKSEEGAYSSQAELKFNPDQARLVVIDGQHRAMAMLAIRRHKAGEWGDKGSHFKHFYEEIADDLRAPKAFDALDKIQMPVCLCFFPSLFERAGKRPAYTTVHCCRKLFLDVNKNAKRPTRARQLLLDDLSLLSAFTRSILTRVREEGRATTNPVIELDAFEYDCPNDLSTPSRDLAICNVQMLQQLIYWSSFGDDAYYVDLAKRPLGRPAGAKKGRERFLAETRFDQQVPSTEVREWGYRDFNKEFDPENTYPAAQARLSALFNEVWGDAIVSMLALLYPFRAHHDAVAYLRAKHRDETDHGALAWRALFDGQGVLWTLETYAEHRAELREDMRKLGQTLPKVRIESAYNTIVNDWLPKEFEPHRAAKYWGKGEDALTEDDRALVNRSFNIYATQAFQVGVLMAFAYLKKRLNTTDPADFKKHVATWIAAWNAIMQRDGGLRAFDRDAKSGGFMSCYFGNLQPADWYWFRYFTFEMIAQSSTEFAGKSEAREAAEKCRMPFLESFARTIQSQEAKLGVELTAEEAEAKAVDRWRGVLKSAVGLKKGDFDKWYENRPKKSKTATAAAIAASVDADDGSASGA